MGFVFDELSGKVIAAALDVHKQLGPGFLEGVYEEALKIALARRGITFEAQKKIEVRFEGAPVGTHILDLLVEKRLIVELKAVGTRVGLLMNFNSAVLVTKRIVN